jgi:hypothetical protein
MITDNHPITLRLKQVADFVFLSSPPGTHSFLAPLHPSHPSSLLQIITPMSLIMDEGLTPPIATARKRKSKHEDPPETPGRGRSVHTCFGSLPLFFPYAIVAIYSPTNVWNV